MTAATPQGSSWRDDEGQALRYLLAALCAAPTTLLLFSFTLLGNYLAPQPKVLPPKIEDLHEIKLSEPPVLPTPAPAVEPAVIEPDRQMLRRRPNPLKHPKEDLRKEEDEGKHRKPVAAKAPIAPSEGPGQATIQSAAGIEESPSPELFSDQPAHEFNELDEIPTLLTKVDPIYPAAARREGIEGRIMVKALIDIDGAVMDVAVVRSMAEVGFDQAAVEAVKQWRYTVPRLGGQPVRVWMLIPIQFKLFD